MKSDDQGPYTELDEVLIKDHVRQEAEGVMIDEHISITYQDIKEAERIAMRKAAEASAIEENAPFQSMKLLFFMGGIRALMDEIEFILREVGKE